MIHHVSVVTNDVARARRLYDAVLPFVGILPMKQGEHELDYGSGQFLFSVETPVGRKPASLGEVRRVV